MLVVCLLLHLLYIYYINFVIKLKAAGWFYISCLLHLWAVIKRGRPTTRKSYQGRKAVKITKWGYIKVALTHNQVVLN